MKILIVLTSHDKLGHTGEKTGFWLEEFAAPYYAFIDAGADVTLASPKGGKPPLDPTSNEDEHQTESTRRFQDDEVAKRALTNTRKLSDIDPDDFAAVFYPGGHGPLWDLSGNKASIDLIRAMLESGKPVGAVCHAPAVLTEVKGANGGYVVSGRRVTGFTNTEEDAVGLTGVVPFLVESRLKQRGGQFGRGDDWASHVEIDGLLVTGQNPASSAPAAEAMIRMLEEQQTQ
ncbi:MAG TPA: type 1 glutamine amidotransferase domain-containing protein [Wenzhouxiangellaceae bacterium]|nr:type 1 glutamine amidotransferase domain-containing protein [Wenzhouxiangellaceae bacterium]